MTPAPQPSKAPPPAKAEPAPQKRSLAGLVRASTQSQDSGQPASRSNGRSKLLSGGIAAAVGGLAKGQPPAATSGRRVSYTSSGGSSVSGRMNAGDAGDTSDSLNMAGDGVQYWGAIDNESARSKAEGMTLIIDQWECISCGTCVENTDAVFVLPDDGKAVAYRQTGNMELIQDAIDACPVTCIHWTDQPTEFEQINDSHGASL